MNGSLTKTETATLLKGLTRTMPRGNYKREDYEALMSWATDARCNAELLDLVLMEYLDPYVTEDGAVRFIATAKGLESSRRQVLERIGI